MPYLETSLLGWTMGLLQVVGLLSAWLTRLNEDSPRQTWCHGLFVSCLVLIALTTMAFVATGAHHWLPSGATMAIMVLAAVWDFRTHAAPAGR
jgi:hypothetical protein